MEDLEDLAFAALAGVASDDLEDLALAALEPPPAAGAALEPAPAAGAACAASGVPKPRGHNIKDISKSRVANARGELKRIRRSVPFTSNDGRAVVVAELGADRAADWITSAFAHMDTDNLANVKEVAAKAMVSRHSVNRATTVIADALLSCQRQKVNDIMSVDACRRGVLVIKRLWDETALRVQLDESQLKAVIGDTSFVEELVRVKKLRKGAIFPGYTLQSLQQLSFVRTSAGGCGEVVIPAKLISGTGTTPMLNGLTRSVPEFSPSRLRDVARRFRALVLRFIPDGAAANRLVMEAFSEAVEQACILESHCASHLLQVVWECGSREALLSSLYSFGQLMVNGANTAKLFVAMSSDRFVPIQIVPGIRAPDDMGFNRMVLRQTVQRELYTKSFFVDVGGTRHHEQWYADKRASLDSECKVLTDGPNSPWCELACRHFCYGALAGDRCCADNAAAKLKVRRSLDGVARHTLSSLRTLAKNKWRSVTDFLSKVSLGTLVHQSLPKAFAGSLGSAGELRKAQEDIRKALEAAVDHELVNSTEAFRLLKGKRTVACSVFFGSPEAQFQLLGMLIAAVPIDKLHATIFESEGFAKTKQSDDEVKVGLIQEFVSPIGLLHTVHGMLSANLLDQNSDFMHLRYVARIQGLDPTKCSNELRGLMLRLSASLKGRFINLFLNEAGDPREEMPDESFKGPWDLFRALGAEPAAQQRIVSRALSNSGCRRCRGRFITRLAERLQAPPELSLNEQAAVVHDLCESTAEDPYVLSMYGCELLHAGARQSSQSCMTRRKALPLTVFSRQCLGRFTSGHRQALGKRRVVPDTVRKTVTKKQSVNKNKHRRNTGHDEFVKRANMNRRALPKAERVDYNFHLQKAHEDWRNMDAEQRREYVASWAAPRRGRKWRH